MEKTFPTSLRWKNNKNPLLKGNYETQKSAGHYSPCMQYVCCRNLVCFLLLQSIIGHRLFENGNLFFQPIPIRLEKEVSVLE